MTPEEYYKRTKEIISKLHPVIHLYNTHGVGGCLELMVYKLCSTHRVGVPQGERIPVQHSWDGGVP